MTVTFYGGVLAHTDEEKSFSLIECTDVHGAIDELGRRFGEKFRKFLLDGENCFFLINGRGLAATGGLATILSPGDKIEVLPFIDAG